MQYPPSPTTDLTEGIMQNITAKITLSTRDYNAIYSTIHDALSVVTITPKSILPPLSGSIRDCFQPTHLPRKSNIPQH